jgi:hypothetical protein
MNKSTKLILLALTITAGSCSGPKNESGTILTASASPANDILSEFIIKDSADRMIGSYLSSLNPKTADSSLRSVSFDASDLRSYLLDSSITGIKISLAHTLEYINNGGAGINAGYNYKALTLIISAYDANGNFRFFNTNNVLDFARPCPNNCPTGQAGNAYFNTTTPAE